jgi:hypothetical protein
MNSYETALNNLREISRIVNDMDKQESLKISILVADLSAHLLLCNLNEEIPYPEWYESTNIPSGVRQ